MKIQYLAHSALWITGDSGVKILIDPFLDRNPRAVLKSRDVSAEYIIITHAHGDHLGDAFAIAKRCGSTMICVDELANICIDAGLKAHNMHIGGGYNFPFGRVKLTFALHGSKTPDGQYAGNPAGVLLTMDGKTIYHAGDTGLFADMKLIGELNRIDAAFLPIGDNYTMGIDDAVKAVEFLNPVLTVPIHYNTFPVIAADPEEFAKKVTTLGKACRILGINETMNL